MSTTVLLHWRRAYGVLLLRMPTNTTALVHLPRTSHKNNTYHRPDSIASGVLGAAARHLHDAEAMSDRL